MTIIDELLSEVRSRLDQITHHINQLPPVESLTDEKWAKMIRFLQKASNQLSNVLDSVPSSPLFITKDPDFIKYLRHDMRNPLSRLRSTVIIIDELHGTQLNPEQRRSTHAIERMAADLYQLLENA